MQPHAHEWYPVPLHAGQYRCIDDGCGATGFRNMVTCVIEAHAQRVEYREPEYDAVPTADEVHTARVTNRYEVVRSHGRRAPKPGQP